jgi:hypothetical protein
MHPGCVVHWASVSPVHGVGVPEHVPVPGVHKHPFEERHVAPPVFDEQGLDVPEQVPVPLSQLQPLAERQVVLVVFEEQVVGVPAQVPVPALHVQPLVNPPLYGHVVLVLVEHAAAVPVHVAGL